MPDRDAGPRYRGSWEMPSPLLVAEVESARGELVWPTLSYLEWEALPWRPVENVTDDEARARAQYQRLRDWADTHAQPIRSVRLASAAPGAWQDVADV